MDVVQPGKWTHSGIIGRDTAQLCLTDLGVAPVLGCVGFHWSGQPPRRATARGDWCTPAGRAVSAQAWSGKPLLAQQMVLRLTVLLP